MKNKKLLKTIVPLLGFMLFFIQGDSYAASPLLVKIAEDFGVSISQAGLSAVSYMIPFGLFTILFGPMGDRLGKMKMISLAAFGTTIFSALGGIAPNLITLCIFRALNGIFAAAIMPVSMALIGEIAGNDPGELHKSLSRTMSLMFFGGAVAPVIGGAIAQFASWRMVYLSYGVFELILSILIVTIIKFKSKEDRNVTLLSSYGGAIANQTLIRTVSIMSFLGFSVLGIYTYLGKFIQIQTGFSIFQVGLIISLYGIGTLIGGRIGPKLREQAGNRYFFLASTPGIVSLLVLTLFSNIYTLCLSVLFLGLSFTLIQPMLIMIAQRSYPQKRGTVMALASFNMCLGGGLGTLLYGFILKQYGFILIFITGAVLFILIASFATGIHKKRPLATAA